MYGQPPQVYARFLFVIMNNSCYNSTNLDGKNEDGDTALRQAIKKKYSQTSLVLVKKGASKLILLVQGELKKSLLYRAITSRQLPFSACFYSCVYTRVLTRVQLTSSRKPSSNPLMGQSGLQSMLGAFTLEVNLG